MEAERGEDRQPGRGRLRAPAPCGEWEGCSRTSLTDLEGLEPSVQEGEAARRGGRAKCPGAGSRGGQGTGASPAGDWDDVWEQWGVAREAAQDERHLPTPRR